MDAKTLTQSNLVALVGELLAGGTRVVGPARASDGKVDYRPVKAGADLVLGGELPRRSLKEFFFPATEPVLHWRQRGADVELASVPTQFGPQVIVGARPCDAAGVEVLDRVMGWDYRDELWFGRREATTIVSLACGGHDRSCFCTATGLGPDSTKGSDVMLYPVDGGYLVEVVTAKGKAFVEAHSGRFGDAPDLAPAASFRQGARDRVAANLTMNPEGVRSWLAGHFDHALWQDIALRCHGCGACASVCPTCHCFDLVDEPDGIHGGTRRRNWDTCQTGKFTVHGSGHNPRHDQHARFRQRVSHKFYIYPTKFEEVLCTGCGRCARACPGGMDLSEILSKIHVMACSDGLTGGAA